MNTTNEQNEQKVQQEDVQKTLEEVNISTLEESSSPEKSIDNENAFKLKKENPFKKVLKSRLIIILSLVLLLSVFSIVFAISTGYSEKIISKVTINNIDVSKLNITEAENKLQQELQNYLSNMVIELKTADDTINIIPSDIDVSFDISKAVNEAFNLGRSSNIISDNYSVLSAKFKAKELNANLNYDEEKLNYIIDGIQSELKDGVIESSYELQDTNLIINSGKIGNRVKKDELKKKILTKIASYNNQTIDVPLEEGTPAPIDIEKIHQEVCRAPQDASLSNVNGKVTLTNHVLGVSFDLETAKEMLNEVKDEYIIPVTITKPKVLASDLGDQAFPNVLGACSTNFNSSDWSRSENIRIATKAMNGTVLMPGEVFSFNKIVGNTTADKGYKTGKIYANGGLQDGIGGGICQTSSTLYNAVLYANLGIVERRNHTYTVGYLPLGRDATIAYPVVDFKFKNNRTYPIKIKAWVSGGTVTFQILGIKQDGDYEVVLENSVLSYTPYETKYIDDTSLSAGSQVKVQTGARGAKVQTYKILKRNGQVISRTLISTDTYKPLDHVLRRGTAIQIIDTPTDTMNPLPDDTTPPPEDNTPIVPDDNGV